MDIRSSNGKFVFGVPGGEHELYNESNARDLVEKKNAWSFAFWGWS